MKKWGIQPEKKRQKRNLLFFEQEEDGIEGKCGVLLVILKYKKLKDVEK